MPSIIRHQRAQFYEAQTPVQGFNRYHLSEKEIAGLWGTETWHPPHFKIPRHAHDLASFYLVLEGSLTEVYNRKQRDIGSCTLVFTPPGEVHRNAFHRAGARCFLVELTQSWDDRIAAADIKVEGSFDTANGEFTRLATSVYKEFRFADKASALSVEGLVLEMLASLHRRSDNVSEAYPPSWLRAARDLLHDRFSETITLTEIAEEVGVHPARLARSFRRRYHCSLGEHQRRLRVEHASRQLVATKCPLQEIALAAGFADQAHFSRVFRKLTGLTPAKFRATFELS